MKLQLFIVCILSASTAHAAINMARVVGVTDSRTIVVDANGRRSTVALSGSAIPAADESAATAYLLSLIDGAWVYVEEGDVYRSPDGLYVNGEMQRHAWRAVPGMRYLGLSIPAPPSRVQAAPATRKAAPPRTAAPRSRSVRTASRSRRR